MRNIKISAFIVLPFKGLFYLHNVRLTMSYFLLHQNETVDKTTLSTLSSFAGDLLLSVAICIQSVELTFLLISTKHPTERLQIRLQLVK